MSKRIENVEKCDTIKLSNAKKIFKIANIMVLALMFILGVSSTGVYAADLNSTPFGTIVKGVENLSKVNTVYSTSKAKITLDTSISKDLNVKMISNIIKSVSVESKVKTNTATKEAFYDMGIKINDAITLNGKMYIKDKTIVISIPELYNKPIYYNTDDFARIAKTNGVKVNTFNADNYKTLFTMDKSKELQAVNEKYGQILLNSVNQLIQNKGEVVLNTENINGEKAQVKCNQYTLNMTLTDVSSILNNLLTKIADDTNFKNLVKSKLEEFFGIVDKNNDYASFNLTKEKVNVIKANFDKSYGTAIEGLKNIISKMNQGCEAKITSNMLIDSNNVLRGSNSEFNIKVKDLFALNITSEGVINSINENMTIDTIPTIGALNIFNASPAEMQDMTTQMQINMFRVFGSLAPVKK